MADYWLSNKRKFCDFCKCWISDNKPSVSFHENGRRHQANISKRLNEITKQSTRDEKVKSKMNSDLRKMEDAAMKAYSFDTYYGADLSAQCITTSTTNAFHNAKSKKPIDPFLPPIEVSDEKKFTRVTQSEEQSLWVEAKSASQDTYYWNIKTAESVWHPPKEGFLKLAEYEQITKQSQHQRDIREKGEAKHFQENADELVARHHREQNIKRYRTDGQTNGQKIDQIESVYDEPYGKWQTICKRESSKINLQLPIEVANFENESIKCTVPEVPSQLFKEKVIKSDDVSAFQTVPSLFKRNIKMKSRHHQRQRIDND